LPNETGVLAVKTVEVLRHGQAVRPLPMLPTVSSRQVRWNGIVVESFDSIPAYDVPQHEHPTNYLNLIRSGRTTCQWTADGHTGSTEEGPGTTYILPAGTCDRLRRSAPTNQTFLVMAPHFLARALEETAHLAYVELISHWNLRDRHIATLMLALHADLEDCSPAGPLYGESLGVALAHYLIRRYSVRAPRELEYKGGMPTVRLNRVLDFMRQNCEKEMRLWELAQLAEMSPHYFCELFKRSTGLSPHQYSLRCRIDRAKIFLGNYEFTISGVAKATGFVDQSHFTKVFRRIVGVTPTQFRADT
jgi:AraC family transcriptional regulator